MPAQIREHGFSTTGFSKKDLKWSSPLTEDDITRSMRSFLASMQSHVAANAEAYANFRVAAGETPEPRYLLSGYGFARGQNPFNRTFSVTYLPARNGAYVVTPRGVKRRWNVIALHQFCEGIDAGQFKKYPGMLSISTDEFGHNPDSFAAGVRSLTERESPNTDKKSIHFMISRRGDVITSVDLNDRAYHAAGNIPPPPPKKTTSINQQSIGFELESRLARVKPGGKIFHPPFSVPQLQALAVVLRKIEAYNPVPRVFLPTYSALTAAASTGGYVRHAVINTPGRRIDINAQFAIPPGQKALIGSTLWETGKGANNDGPYRTGTPADQLNMQQSGWDQLWGYMDQIRGYNLATEVFDKPPSVLDLRLAEASEAVSKASNRGQRVAVQATRDELNAMRRSEQMQGQDRRTVYQNALATNQAASLSLTKSTMAVNTVVDSHNSKTVKGVTAAAMFNEATGLWSDGLS